VLPIKGGRAPVWADWGNSRFVFSFGSDLGCTDRLQHRARNRSGRDKPVVRARSPRVTAILLGLAPRRRIGPAMRFFDLLFYGYIGATPQILVSGALINFPHRSLAGRGPL